MGLNAHALQLRAESQAASDAVVQKGDVFVFKLDDTVAVDADEVVVLGFVEEIGVVVGLVAPEIDVAEKTTFDHEGKGPIDGGAGDGAIHGADTVEEFFRIKMFVRGEHRVHNDLALAGAAQTFAGKVVIESLGDLGVHEGAA